MSLGLADVDAIAELSKLHLTDEERVRFAAQLSHILDAIQVLQRLDTSNIPPTATVLPLRTVLRDDAVVPPIPREVVLANAPAAENGQFVVQAVLD